MKPRRSIIRRAYSSLRDNVIAGVLTLAPIGAVLWIVVWLWNLLMGLSGVLPANLNPKIFLNIEHPIANQAIDVGVMITVLSLLVLFVWVAGVISRNYLGRRLLVMIGRSVSRLPVLSTVYSTLEQLLKTFASGQSKNFRRVVQIEYPRRGLFALALVTGERGKMLNIYVPTTPNPTSGFYLSVPAEDVREMDMSVEEALKEIISMGIVQKQ